MRHSDTKGYTGHQWQGGGTQRIRFMEGKAEGTKAILVDNGCGLSFTVLEDRCLDIYSLNVKGCNVPFLTKSGPVHPAYYDSSEWEWLRSFAGGFLATCGLTQAGEPCRYSNAAWGLHGPVSNLPAENVRIDTDDERIILSGSVRQYKFQTEDLLLERKITIQKKSNHMTLSDTITNEGWSEQPFMLLYHFNFGYPFLNENSCLILPPSEMEGWDAFSNAILDQHMAFGSPDASYQEQTFIHTIRNREGKAQIFLADDMQNPGMAVLFEYDPRNMPYITQWKHFKPCEYVMAIEPCNNHVKGALWENENGTLQTIAPGEKKCIEFSILFMDETEQIRQSMDKMTGSKLVRKMMEEEK